MVKKKFDDVDQRRSDWIKRQITWGTVPKQTNDDENGYESWGQTRFNDLTQQTEIFNGRKWIALLNLPKKSAFDSESFLDDGD